MIEKINTLKNSDLFENWLQAMAINKCKELFPQSKLDNNETLSIIDEIVDGLSEKHRMVIMMYYYFDGCSSLETVTMNYDVYSIGSNAFKDCKSLIY